MPPKAATTPKKPRLADQVIDLIEITSGGRIDAGHPAEAKALIGKLEANFDTSPVIARMLLGFLKVARPSLCLFATRSLKEVGEKADNGSWRIKKSFSSAMRQEGLSLLKEAYNFECKKVSESRQEKAAEWQQWLDSEGFSGSFEVKQIVPAFRKKGYGTDRAIKALAAAAAEAKAAKQTAEAAKAEVEQRFNLFLAQLRVQPSFEEFEKNALDPLKDLLGDDQHQRVCDAVVAFRAGDDLQRQVPIIKELLWPFMNGSGSTLAEQRQHAAALRIPTSSQKRGAEQQRQLLADMMGAQGSPKKLQQLVAGMFGGQAAAAVTRPQARQVDPRMYFKIALLAFGLALLAYFVMSWMFGDSETNVLGDSAAPIGPCSPDDQWFEEEFGDVNLPSQP